MKMDVIKAAGSDSGFGTIAPPHFFHVLRNHPQTVWEMIELNKQRGKRALRRLRGKRLERARRLWHSLPLNQQWRLE